VGPDQSGKPNILPIGGLWAARECGVRSSERHHWQAVRWQPSFWYFLFVAPQVVATYLTDAPVRGRNQVMMISPGIRRLRGRLCRSTAAFVKARAC
jgi:hypothetical protein